MHRHNYLSPRVCEWFMSAYKHYLDWNKVVKYQLHLNSIWVNEMKSNEYNPIHIHQGNLPTGLFTFPKETGGEGDVAPQTQGSSKAQLDFDITMTDAPAQYIAGFVRISRQMLDDVPAMTSFLQARLLEKYLLAEESKVELPPAEPTTSSKP